MIDVAIVIPYYNESPTISQTLDLIKIQSFKPKEVIFVNSSSTDNTSEIIDLWISNQPDKNDIHYLNIKSNSKTPSSSKNIGITNSNSNWIAFMDCGLFFNDNWLEDLVFILEKNDFKISIISGVCRLHGHNPFDICAVAQTYGVGTDRVCIPGSIVKREVFNRTGLFHENMRASYDRAWQMKTRKQKIGRITPKKNNVSYIGVNFSKSSINLIRKVIIYSKPAVRIQGYYTPILYIFFAVFFMLTCLYSAIYGGTLLLFYILFRGYFVPFYKSNKKDFLLNSINNILLLPYVGILLDISRLFGYIIGFNRKLIEFINK